MNRTEYWDIYLPMIVDKESPLAKDWTRDEFEYANATSIRYARQTTHPTLRNYVTRPFTRRLRELAMQEAAREGKVKLVSGKAKLKENHAKTFDIDGLLFGVTVFPTSRPSYEPITSSTIKFLDDIIAESAMGIVRGEVHSSDDGVYISANHLMNIVGGYLSDNSIFFDSCRVARIDPETQKRISLRDDIVKMRVFLDSLRCTVLSPHVAGEFYDAKSLDARVAKFDRDANDWVMLEYGVPRYGMTESLQKNFGLPDGWGLGYLFYPNHVYKYGLVYKALFNKKGDKKNIDVGDIELIRLMAFQKDKNLRGKSGLSAKTQIDETDQSKGTFVVSKHKKDGSKTTSTYHIKKIDDEVYVRIADIERVYKRILGSELSVPTRLKIEFFPPEPEHLRQIYRRV